MTMIAILTRLLLPISPLTGRLQPPRLTFLRLFRRAVFLLNSTTPPLSPYLGPIHAPHLSATFPSAMSERMDDEQTPRCVPRYERESRIVASLSSHITPSSGHQTRPPPPFPAPVRHQASSHTYPPPPFPRVSHHPLPYHNYSPPTTP